MYVSGVALSLLGVSATPTIVYPNDVDGNTINTAGIWTNRFRVQTNLHLNHYGQHNYYIKVLPIIRAGLRCP